MSRFCSENNEASKELEKFKETIKSIRVKTNWHEFSEHFISVHPNFYKNLSYRHSGLSSAELKLCTLIRLNLSSKEIADITYRTPGTVKTLRARLRKKLGISTEQGLATYLLRF